MAHQLRCASCGAAFDLTAEYLAQYGGQTTACTCGAALEIPGGGDSAGAGAAGGAVRLSYAGPSRGSTKIPERAWRDGHLLVMSRGTRLPHRCATCATPVPGKFKPRVLLADRGTKGASLTSVLLRRFLSDRVTARFGYCREHLPWRMSVAGVVTGIAVPALIIPLGIAASIVGDKHPTAFVVILALMIAAIVWSFIVFLLSPYPISVAGLDYKHVWLEGFGEEYLKQFPTLEERREKDAGEAAARLDGMGAEIEESGA
jgi:hypothetical protein